MSDGVVLDAGSGGDTVAADDCAGTKYQVVKLADGTADATTVVAAGGGVEANALRVTIASDSTGVVSVDDNGGSLTVDGTVAATQSGAWNITDVSGTVSLPTGASTAAKQPALGTAGTASADVITVQGIASMTALKVDGSAVTQPVSIAGTQPINIGQVASNTVDSNSGVKSAGTLRVVLATDQPALTNKLLVTPDANSAVNVAQINGVAATMGAGNSGTGVLRVVIATDQPAFTNKVPTNVAQINAVTPLMGNGVTGTGSQRVTIASDNTAFSVNAVQSGTWTVQPGNTANTTAWLVQDVAGTTGGASFSGFVGAASNNKTQIKGSAGTLYSISVQNLASTPVYLKVFDKTSANVTAGTTACDYQFMIPGNTAGAGLVFDSAKGIAHANGITVMLTAGIATTDNTSVSANNQVATIAYK